MADTKPNKVKKKPKTTFTWQWFVLGFYWWSGVKAIITNLSLLIYSPVTHREKKFPYQKN